MIKNLTKKQRKVHNRTASNVRIFKIRFSHNNNVKNRMCTNHIEINSIIEKDACTQKSHNQHLYITRLSQPKLEFIVRPQPNIHLNMNEIDIHNTILT